MEESKAWQQKNSLKLNRVQYKVPLGRVYALGLTVLPTPPTNLQNYNLQTYGPLHLAYLYTVCLKLKALLKEKKEAFSRITELIPFQKPSQYTSKSHIDSNASRNDQNISLKNKRTLPSRRIANTSKLYGSPKPTRLNTISVPSEDGGEHSRESWEGKPINSCGSSAHGSRMTEIIQRRCKNVISKLQRRIDKEGHQIVPLLTDLWKRIENSGNNLLDLRKMDQRIDKLVYTGATDLVFDVQFMLKSTMLYYGFSLETSETQEVHSLLPVQFLPQPLYRLLGQ
ncbi:hypothetical protein KIW84_056267 [Lathyrus oleraceus]|uniref:Uncharacterized protein n=1 Tax=Pisum sativum TaxID=3888 RepID=A0A9D5AMB6_PEA|nr:hypothetical protein KIW84_056267 [Pisum sativum]